MLFDEDSDVAVPECDGDSFYEVVNGQRIEVPPMGAFQTSLAATLLVSLGSFLRERKLGRVVGEMLFRLDAAKVLDRRPDVAFVSYKSWPKSRRVPSTAAWEVIPELAVEIVSPTNGAEDVVEKNIEYFNAGVRLVWVIFPEMQQAYVYTSPTAIRVVDRTGELDGGEVVPGFRLPLAELFETDETA
jgi:Uma2 family endonuclease